MNNRQDIFRSAVGVNSSPFISPLSEPPTGCRSIFSPTEIRRAIAALIEPGAVFEVRCVDAVTADWKKGKPRVVAGYFDNAQAVVDALPILASAKGVYLTLNPPLPDLLARANNRLEPGLRATTGDKDITRRRWLYIDCDPVRPAGISATDEEMFAAVARAAAVAAWLREQGFPDPVTAESGNGAHLLYRIDLPADDGGLVSRVLQAVAKQFDDEAVEIDQTNSNPARICRLYGTLACKGDSMPNRPHRRSRMTAAPAAHVVPRELLERIAGTVASDAATATATATDRERGDFDLLDFLQKQGVEATERGSKDGWEIWAVQCPWDPSHANGDAKVFRGADGRLGFKCHHNSSTGRDWKAFRQRLDPGCYERRSDPIDPNFADRPPMADAVVTATRTATVATVDTTVDTDDELEAPQYVPPAWDEVLEAVKRSPIQTYMDEARKAAAGLPEEFLLADAVLLGCLVMAKHDVVIGVQGDHSPRRCNAYIMKVGGSGTGKGITSEILLACSNKLDIERLHGRSEAAIAMYCGIRDGKPAANYKPLAKFGLCRFSEVAKLISPTDPVAVSLRNCFLAGYDEGQLIWNTGPNGRERRIVCEPFAPSLLVEAQPALIENCAGRSNLDSGFLARFLVARAAETGRAKRIKKAGAVDIAGIVKKFGMLASACKNGKVSDGRTIIERPGHLPDTLGDAYLKHMTDGEAASWSRLASDYLPRIAAIIGCGTIIQPNFTEENICRAGVVVDWFFAQSQAILGLIHDDRWEMRRVRMERLIALHPGCNDRHLYRALKCSSSDFERDLVPTLLARGRVRVARDCSGKRTWHPRQLSPGLSPPSGRQQKG